MKQRKRAIHPWSQTLLLLRVDRTPIVVLPYDPLEEWVESVEVLRGFDSDLSDELVFGSSRTTWFNSIHRRMFYQNGLELVHCAESSQERKGSGGRKNGITLYKRANVALEGMWGLYEHGKDGGGGYSCPGTQNPGIGAKDS